MKSIIQLILTHQSIDEGYHGDMSVGDDCVGKNVLCVGAAQTNQYPTTVASFSSRGPSKDQRIKPDVVAPGKNRDNSCCMQRILSSIHRFFVFHTAIAANNNNNHF